MAELKVYLSNSLSDRFRMLAMTVYGYGRGSLSKAAEEAFAKWCVEHESSPDSNRDRPAVGCNERAKGNRISGRSRRAKNERARIKESYGRQLSTLGLGHIY